MIKKLLSILLTATLAFSTLPTLVFAKDNPIDEKRITCTCEVACLNDAVEIDCEQCSTDISKCIGIIPAQPNLNNTIEKPTTLDMSRESEIGFIFDAIVSGKKCSFKITSTSPLEVSFNKADITMTSCVIPSIITNPTTLTQYNVTSIGNSAFENCCDLTSITIPDGVTRIGNSAFFNCDSLISIEISDKVISIGDYAFIMCSELVSIDVHEKNENYSDVDGVLYDKNKTIIIRYPSGKPQEKYEVLDSVTSIGNSAFSGGNNLISITIPNSVTNIGDGAFGGCRKITSFGIPNSITSIGDTAFINCNSLMSITIPDSVTSIGRGAFQYCNSLISITMNSITQINENLFYGCSALTTVTVPRSVTFIYISAFSNCNALNSIKVDENNERYSDVNGVLYDKNKKVLIKYPTGKTQEKYEVPNGVTSIGNNAFELSNNLVSITVINGVTFVGSNAFDNCAKLRIITFIPTTPPKIGGNIFNNCSNLNNIYVRPKSVAAYKKVSFLSPQASLITTMPDDILIKATIPDVEKINYPNVQQKTYSTEIALNNYVKNITMTEINSEDIDFTVNKHAYITPIAGTTSEINGTDGYYEFNITVSKGLAKETTSQKRILIVATPYVKPKPDNNPNNSNNNWYSPSSTSTPPEETQVEEKPKVTLPSQDSKNNASKVPQTGINILMRLF